MPSPPARGWIFAYTGAVALLNLSVLLPGNPDFASSKSVVVGLAIQALIVWRLWHGSELAWLFGLAGALLALASVILMDADITLGIVLLLVLSFLQFAILCSPPMLTFIWSQPASPAAR
jgi:hypothetical protein